MQRLENNRLSDSDPDEDPDSELSDVDSEVEDGLLSDVGKDLWYFLGDFIKALYATHAGPVTDFDNYKIGS